MAKYQFKAEPHLGRALALDTETTGLSPKCGDKIAELAAMELIDGQPTGNSFHTYINPGIPMPYEAEAVHGLSDAFLADKPYFEDIASDFMSFVGDTETIIWAHNAPFDARFVNAELEMIGMETLDGFSCSLKLARAIYGKGDRKLQTLAQMAGVRFDGRGAHSALADTKVLSAVLTTLLWPAEAKLALNPAAAQPRAARTPKAAPRAAPRITLPEGFAPLTPRDDARICRYDDRDINHLITARGKRWTEDEEAGLVEAFLQKQSEVIDLVETHGRTPAALFMKLEALGVIAQDHPYARAR